MQKENTSNKDKDKAGTYDISIQELCHLRAMTVCLTTSFYILRFDKLRQKGIQ
jgi:hypothetical protein